MTERKKTIKHKEGNITETINHYYHWGNWEKTFLRGLLYFATFLLITSMFSSVERKVNEPSNIYNMCTETCQESGDFSQYKQGVRGEDIDYASSSKSELVKLHVKQPIIQTRDVTPCIRECNKVYLFSKSKMENEG